MPCVRLGAKTRDANIVTVIKVSDLLSVSLHNTAWLVSSQHVGMAMHSVLVGRKKFFCQTLVLFLSNFNTNSPVLKPYIKNLALQLEWACSTFFMILFLIHQHVLLVQLIKILAAWDWEEAMEFNILQSWLLAYYSQSTKSAADALLTWIRTFSEMPNPWSR